MTDPFLPLGAGNDQRQSPNTGQTNCSFSTAEIHANNRHIVQARYLGIRQ